MTTHDATRAPALVFGGTFDPPHRVHVRMATAAADCLGARAILVIPAAINPQRAARPPAPAADRRAMTLAAFAGEPRARVLDLELERTGPSYTVDTVRALHDQGAAPLRLLIGSDQALNFPTWRAWREVAELAPPAIVVRPPQTHATLLGELRRVFGAEAEAWATRILPIPPTDMSATDVRAALARGEGPDALDPAILAYIRRHGLYGVPPSQSS